MTAIVDRIREQRAVVVTDRQAAAVLGDLADNMRRLAGEDAFARAAVVQASPESFRIGFAAAIELVEQAIGMHAEPTTGATR